MSSLSEEQKKRIEENRRKAQALRANRGAVQPAPSNYTGSNAFKPQIHGNVTHSSSGSILKGNPPRVGFTNVHHPTNSSPTTATKPRHTILIPPQPFSAPNAAPSQTTSTFHNQGQTRNNFSAKATPPKKTSSSKFTPSQTTSTFHNQGQTRNKFSVKATPPKKANSLPSGAASFGSPSAPKVQGKCVLASAGRFVVDIGYSGPLITVFKTIPSKLYDANSKLWSFNISDHRQLLQKTRELSDAVLIDPLPQAVLATFSEQLALGDKAVFEPDLSIVDAKLVTALLPFQKEGVMFALQRGGRALIADDMGLGKTLQALCVAAYYRKQWPLLIVTPSSVRYAWREQILRWLPSVDAQQINVVATSRDSCCSGLINILSYDLMVRQGRELADAEFKVIIIKAARVILLSGTPALSRPSELYSQISAVNPRVFPKFHEYGLRYCEGKQMPWGWDYTGSSNLAELQLLLEKEVMVRRLKSEVLQELPAKLRTMVCLDPDSVKVNRNLKASQSHVSHSKGSDQRGALLQYFHETGSVKIPAVREYILQLLEADKKFLLFAHHQEMMDALQEAIISKKYQCIRIDGRTSGEQRNQFVQRFQTQDAVRVAVLSITAANAGLNLTACSLVVFAELFWNPGIMMQAEDRAHRIGQKDSVNVQYLVAKSTADDYIWPLVQQKLQVLSKAGLSKNDFGDADTTQLKDSKQRDILSYFEASFIESTPTTETATSSDSVESSTLLNESVTNEVAGQSTLLNYFKMGTDNKTPPGYCQGKPYSPEGSTWPEDDDDLDELMMQEESADSPWPPPLKMAKYS